MLLITIIVGLLNTNYFYNATYTAFYFFCITALILIIITILYLYLTNYNGFKFKKPIIYLGLFSIYLLWQYFNHKASTLFFIYCLVHFFLLMLTTEIFSTTNFNFKRFCFGIVLIATIQSLYCLGQYLGVFNSQNEQFRVSGSWTNPNVTAEFLAMIMPVFLFLLQSKFKKIVQLSLIILVIAIGLLKCRSAYIGAVLSVLVFYALQYDFANWFKNPKNKSSRSALLIIALLIIIPTATYLYESKKASAEGRQFIWKLSTLMTIQKPLTGYGYGSFSKEYNLFQAKYIEEGKASLVEEHNAGPTITAHNELLQNAVEGGIVGLALVLFFWGSILLSNREKSKEELARNSISQPKDIADKNNLFHLAYSGIFCFMAMSLFNFTYQAAPVATLFTIYSAIICSFSQPLKPHIFFLFLNRKWISILANILIIMSSSYFLYVVINIAYTDSLNQKALLLKKELKVNEALASISKLEPWLKEESNYWENYALILFQKKEYQSSLNCLSKAKETSSSTNLYLGSGVCYEKLKQYPQAIEEYNQLVLLHPSKFHYRFRLLTAYMKTKDTANVLFSAQSIIDLKPKIPSEEVVRYKKTARQIRIAFDKNTQKYKTNNNQFSIKKNLFHFQK